MHGLAGGRAALKRLVDVLGSVALLVVLSPLLVVIAICIRLDSAGPVIFEQTRIGLHKRRYTMYKFRSMVHDADARFAALTSMNEEDGPAFKIRDDPRVTRVGRVLRRLSLDELPQLFNVLKGEMSLVGPRPLFAWEFERIDEPWVRRRFSVQPGVTGLWQVSGRSDLPFSRRIELDLHYIDTWSLSGDLRILAKTVTVVASGRGAV
jgi:exopolysaccharide biosynthesis polyprenyl glycosylphosphotransferase